MEAAVIGGEVGIPVTEAVEPEAASGTSKLKAAPEGGPDAATAAVFCKPVWRVRFNSTGSVSTFVETMAELTCKNWAFFQTKFLAVYGRLWMQQKLPKS